MNTCITHITSSLCDLKSKGKEPKCKAQHNMVARPYVARWLGGWAS